RMSVLDALGQVHWFQTRYDQALAFYQQVHTLACQAGSLLYQGLALLNMSMVYNELGDPDHALHLATQSLQLFREIGSGPREAQTLYTIGDYTMQLGRWQVAQGYFQQAIKLYESLGIMARLADLYWGYGFLHHMLGDESESETAYLQAFAI